MALALLDELKADLDRLTWAGALAARGDERLRAHQQALATLGAQVPALAKTAKLVEAIQHGPEAELAVSFLQLGSAVAQLLSTQSALGTAPQATTALSTATLGQDAPLAPNTLYPVHDALASKKKPADIVSTLIAETSAAGDPRLWPAMLAGLNNQYLRDVLVLGLARLGPILLPLLKSRLKKKGKEADAARLRVIGRISGAADEPLYRELLEAGSPEMRLAALECLSCLGEEAWETLVINTLEATTEAYPRDLLALLARVGSERAIRRLLDYLTERKDPGYGAFEGARSEKIASIVEVARAHLRANPRSVVSRAGFIVFLLNHPAPSSIDLLCELLRHSEEETRNNAAEALLRQRDPKGLRAVSDLDDVTYSVKAMFALGESVAFDRLSPLLPKDSGSSSGGFFSRLFSAKREGPTLLALDGRLLTAFNQISADSDRRWIPPLIALVGRGHGLQAVATLGRLRATDAIPRLLALLGEGEGRDHWAVVITALREIGSRSALPALEKLSKEPELTTFLRQYLAHAIATIQESGRE